ncbi:MAG: type II secretion system F family protein [Chloroflexota bacterium]
MDAFVVIVPVLAFVTIILAAMALLAPAENTLQSRLRAYGYDPAVRPGGDLTLSFYERVIVPFGRGVGSFVLRFTPGGIIESTRVRLRDAHTTGISIGLFMLARAASGVLLVCLYYFYAMRGGNITLMNVGLALLFFYAGQRLPDIWLSLRIDSRRAEITKALPDALDLIVVCVEAGFGLEAAIAKVTESTRGALSEEFGQMLREVSLGRARRDALRDMSERSGSPDLQTFVAALLLADAMGVSIGTALRVQADAMRIRRRQRAEEQIAKAPVKMIFPLAAFIFPSLFVVLLGPAMIKIFGMFATMGGG